MSQIKSSKIILLITIFLVIFAVYFSLSKMNDDGFESKGDDVVNLNLPDSEDTKENDFVVGPGLPGPEDMVYWYVPDSLKDNKLDSSPYFPAISQYSDSMNYTRRTMMTVWYFDSSEDLKNGEKELYRYVKEHGELFDDTVNITEQVLEHGNNRIFGSTNLNVTRYESEETSGYFAVIIKPFLNSLNNYFIIYYGTNEKSLEEELDTIKNLMAKEYYMANKNGYVRGLNDYNVTVGGET